MQVLIDDLRYAQAAGVMVKVSLLNGEQLITDVCEVNEAEGFITLGAPEAYQDTTTTQKVALDLVRSVAVTDISAGLDRPFL
jgi:hypothetical protein